MPPRILEAEIAQFVCASLDNPIPFLRCYFQDMPEGETDRVFRNCTAVTYSFEEYVGDSSKEPAQEEKLTVTCFGKKTDVGLLISQHVYMRFNIVLRKSLAESFRDKMYTTGLWWLILHNDAESDRVSFTVNPQGEILGRHTLSPDGEITSSIHDSSVH